jgi:hypothetical protein
MAGPGVKSKASIKLFERITKYPGGWGIVKELSYRIAEV